MATKAADRPGFARVHRWDRNAVLACVIAVWTALVTGFGIDLVQRAGAHMLTYPWVVHAHALCYVGWVVLLAAQIWLVRTRRVAVHRRLGTMLLLLLPLMMVLGPATAISLNAADPAIKPGDLSFMSTQFTNVLGATTLIAAGFLARRDAASHKRLMLMGTIAITEPGFSRIWASPLSSLLGDGYLPYYFSTYIGTLVLMIAAGGYDLATRRRLHSAYIAAFCWILANQVAATWLFYQPFWLAWMTRLTGH